MHLHSDWHIFPNHNHIVHLHIETSVPEYGYEFVSAVEYENVYGFQPHPEKSHECGLKIIKNFMEI